jgi:protein-S-isoprenylcysteine O-methyltransferase Ste14
MKGGESRAEKTVLKIFFSLSGDRNVSPHPPRAELGHVHPCRPGIARPTATVFAAAFNFPVVSKQEFFHSGMIALVGVVLCLAGSALLLLSLVSFGKSFRVGIDTDHPDKLITTGVFAFSRNPIYVAFGTVLFGQFLVFPNWILLVYLYAGIWLFHRQVLREEEYLKKHYGKEYPEYCNRVRRYF